MTTVLTTLLGVECYKCHVLFGMTEDFNRRAHETGTTFYCTNGHGQSYCETENARLKKQVEAAKAEVESWKARNEQKARALVSRDHVIRAERGAKTKLKKRIAAGLCPCCNRTFQNLAGHMKGQHPEYTVSEAKPAG